MDFKVLNGYVLLEIPRESRYTKIPGKDEEIKLPELKVSGVRFNVLSVGDDVAHIQVGDKVMLFKGKGEGVNVIAIDGIEYILTQFFDVEMRLKRENEK